MEGPDSAGGIIATPHFGTRRETLARGLSVRLLKVLIELLVLPDHSNRESSAQRGSVTACGLYGWASFRWIFFSDFLPILICGETVRPINPSDFYFRQVDALDNLLRLDYPVAHLRAARRFRVACANVKNPNQHAFFGSLSPPPKCLFSPEFNG